MPPIVHWDLSIVAFSFVHVNAKARATMPRHRCAGRPQESVQTPVEVCSRLPDGRLAASSTVSSHVAERCKCALRDDCNCCLAALTYVSTLLRYPQQLCFNSEHDQITCCARLPVAPARPACSPPVMACEPPGSLPATAAGPRASAAPARACRTAALAPQSHPDTHAPWRQRPLHTTPSVRCALCCHLPTDLTRSPQTLQHAF
jgi:hypothetical protein